MRRLLARLLAHHGRLLRFLGPFPGVPGFTLQPVELLQFQVAHLVEVADCRFAPLLADAPQVVGHRGLGDF